jgi:hypothetical protein
MMRFLCWMNLHNWHREGWSGRVCHHCDRREIRTYTADAGAVWERV